MRRRVFISLVAAAGLAGWLLARATSSSGSREITDLDSTLSPARISDASSAQLSAPPIALLHNPPSANVPLASEIARNPPQRVIAEPPRHTPPPPAMPTVRDVERSLNARLAQQHAFRGGITLESTPGAEEAHAHALQGHDLSKLVLQVEQVTILGDVQISGSTITFALQPLIESYDPADLDRNGTIDGEDLRELVRLIDTADGGADLDGNGLIDGADMAEFLLRYPS
ncbi:MAG TPA: hypothetical protein VK157_16480 [Phycisphaerales bacterium]|nr:hypothetical protein [Phycisphaerales bacterium]